MQNVQRTSKRSMRFNRHGTGDVPLLLPPGTMTFRFGGLNMTSVSKNYLTTKEAARFLCVSYQSLEKGRCGHSPINPPFIRIGRAVRYELEDLKVWMDQRRHNR